MLKQKILCILLVISILLSYSAFSFASDNTQVNEENDITNTEDLNELNDKRNETQQKIQEVNSKIEYVQTEMSNSLIEIQELDDKIKEYEVQNEDLTQKLDALQKSVDETTEKLNIVTEEHDKKEKLLKDRLVTLYEEGDIAYIDVLLSANSLSEFLSIYYAMVEMAEYDNKLIDEVESQRKTIEESKQKLESETKQLTNLKIQAEQTRTILANTKSLQEGKVQKLSNAEKSLNEEIKKYKTEMLAIEAKILELNGYDGEIAIQYTGGLMMWPVAIPGTGITSPYGTREHPIQGVIKLHQGIDIGNVGFGAPVVAALDGYVTYAGELGSYGNCVMIYHGNGIVTLYGHGQEILTQTGAEVKQGDIIMKTGSTGNSTGPHLHFEVRLNGITTDPLNYVKEP